VVLLLVRGRSVPVLNEEGEEMQNLLNNTVFAVVISLIISLAYFTLIDHFLMDMQGLDYWYLFRK
jgi:hypothetical protein